MARAQPEERPDGTAIRAPIEAWTELISLRMLSGAMAQPDDMPFSIEAAMRLAMNDEMDLEAWVDLFAAFDHTGQSGGLGLQSTSAEPVTAACAALGLEGSGALDLVSELAENDDAPVELVAAAETLARTTRALREEPLCWIDTVEADGAGHRIRARILVGTGHPGIHVTSVQGEAPVSAGRLCFWDGAADAVEVPEWLARWDERARTLRVYNGRDRATRKWRYIGRKVPGDLLLLDRPDGSPPVYLAEPTWSTPAPAPQNGDANAETAMFATTEGASRTTQMALPRSYLPEPDANADEHQAEDQLILRVIAGRDLMRFAVVPAGAAVVIGRHAGEADFVIAQHQISRRHTQVRQDDKGSVFTRDLGSTNGTQLNGNPIGDREVRVRPGDVVAAGPILLRLEWATPGRIAKLEKLLGGGDSETERRDPLTQLLKPVHLIEELPAELQAGFREGGGAPGAPPLWGVLLYIGRLTAIHAQHGERVADGVFVTVTRMIKFEVENPERCVRVGYGEILVPVVGVDRTRALEIKDRLMKLVEDYVWEPPINGVNILGEVGRKEAGEPATVWLQRIRKQLQESRFKRWR